MLARYFCASVVGCVLLFPYAVKAQEEKAPDADKTEAAADSAPKSEEEAGEEHAHIGEAGVSKDVTDLSPPLAIYTFVMFLLLVAILWKFAWGPIATALDKREENIRKDITDAEAARVKAEEMLAAHAEKLEKVQDEVREILAEARRDAEHTKQEIINVAQKEAEATKDRAIGEIDRAKDAALTELFDTMASQVTEATEHVLGRALNADDQERLIQDAMSQFSQN